MNSTSAIKNAIKNWLCANWGWKSELTRSVTTIRSVQKLVEI